MGTAIKHPMPDRVESSSFVIFDIRTLWHLVGPTYSVFCDDECCFCNNALVGVFLPLSLSVTIRVQYAWLCTEL